MNLNKRFAKLIDNHFKKPVSSFWDSQVDDFYL